MSNQLSQVHGGGEQWKIGTPRVGVATGTEDVLVTGLPSPPGSANAEKEIRGGDASDEKCRLQFPPGLNLVLVLNRCSVTWMVSKERGEI